jgi:hypothetical protein
VIAVGTRVGAFEVTGRLGADTKLGRDVALTVLPAGFGDDPTA